MSNQLPFYLWKRLEGERENDRFGHRIACGDINGDGKDEWVISASTATVIDGKGGVNPVSLHYVGRVYVYSSDLQLLCTLHGEYAGDFFGTSLVLGDINGDGIKEIIVGAPQASSEQWVQCGQISVFSGVNGKRLYRWYGNEDYARLGAELTVLDWDGDGILDVAAASHLSRPDGVESHGRVSVFSSVDQRVIAEFTGTGQEGLGMSLAAGDVNGDGKDELIIGAPRSSTSGFIQNGKVVVFSKNHGLIHQSMGKRSYDRYGFSLAVGDLDGDGIAELLIGSPKVSLGLTGDGFDQLRNGFPKMGLKHCGMIMVVSVIEDRVVMEKTGWLASQGLGTSILPLVNQADKRNKVAVGSDTGIVYIFDLNGNVAHEFHGYLPEAYSHSLAIGRSQEGEWIAIGAITGLNQQRFMAGSVYFMSPVPPADTVRNDPPTPIVSSVKAKKMEYKRTDKLRILLATYWYLPHVGGVDVYCRTLKEELERRGHHVDILAHYPDMAHYYLVGGDRKVEKWPIKRVIYENVFEFYLRYLPHVEPWIRWRDIERYCYEAAATLFNLEQYDVIHTQDIISTRALSRVKPASTPLVATIHGLLAKEYLISGQIASRDSLAWKYVCDEEFYGCTSAEATIIPTEWLRKELAEIEVPSEQLVVIPYGMDIEAFERKTAEALAAPVEKKGTFTICCPARLVPVKGHITLLKALQRLLTLDVSWHCWLIGDGELRPKLEQFIDECGLHDRVSMLGDRNDVPSLLKQADLFVLPSIQDNLPFSIMEAQLAGVPTVACHAGGIPEMIKHEETGLLFEAGNDERLAQHIETMIADQALREKMAKEAQDWARREWSVSTLLQRTLEVYQNALMKVRGN